MKSIRHNAIMNCLLSVLQIIFPLITFPYTSRVLGVVANGRITFANSIVAYFTLFATLGLTTYGIKACAVVREDKEKLSKTVHELLLINLITTSIATIVLIFTVMFIPKLKREVVLILIHSVGMILNVAGLNWFYSGIEQYDYITVRSLITKLIALVLMFILVRDPSDVYIYAAITVFSVAGANIFNIVHARHYIDYKWFGNYDLKKHLVPTVTLFVTLLAVNVYTNLDNVMLGFMTNDYQVGLYHASVRIRSVITTMVTSLGAVLLPRLSNYLENNKTTDFYRVLKKSFLFTCAASCSLSVFFLVFAKEGILFLSGKEFLGSVLPMQIMIWLIAITGFSNILGMQILIPSNRENRFMQAVIVGAIVDLILNLFMIPKYAAVGAAIATLAAEISQFSIQIWFTREEIKKFVDWRDIIKVAVACSLAIVTVLPIKFMVNLSPFFILLISGTIYYIVFIIALWIEKYRFVTDLIEQFTKGKIKRH